MRTRIKTVPKRIFSSLSLAVFFIIKAFPIYLDDICANSEGTRAGEQKQIYDYFGQWKFIPF